MQTGDASNEVEETLFDRVGGHDTFRAIVGRFFDEVRATPDVAALYPQDDWDGAESRLLLFFEQYWGGPMTYSRTRGAPMLKMRHMPYKITEDVARQWAICMHRAVAGADLEDDDADLMHDYVDRACIYLINAD